MFITHVSLGNEPQCNDLDGIYLWYIYHIFSSPKVLEQCILKIEEN